MPLIKIYRHKKFDNTCGIRGDLDLKDCIKRIFLENRSLQLRSAKQLSIIFIQVQEPYDNSIIVEVIHDLKPRRTKKVMDGVAKEIVETITNHYLKEFLENEMRKTLIEVFCFPFELKKRGYANNKKSPKG